MSITVCNTSVCATVCNVQSTVFSKYSVQCQCEVCSVKCVVCSIVQYYDVCCGPCEMCSMHTTDTVHTAGTVHNNSTVHTTGTVATTVPVHTPGTPLALPSASEKAASTVQASVYCTSSAQWSWDAVIEHNLTKGVIGAHPVSVIPRCCLPDIARCCEVLDEDQDAPAVLAVPGPVLQPAGHRRQPARQVRAEGVCRDPGL